MIQFLVAAPCSGSGKTTLTCALLAALKRRGQDPCSFKSGPDYIDPMFHRAVLGVESHNLDLFFSAPETVRALYAQAAAGHGAAVCEGAMGFYDGLGGVSDTASAWHLADTLGLPVLLVVQPRGASLTLAAQINGLKQFRTPSHLAGILLNDCAPHLYALLAPMLERETGLPVLGYLPHLPDAALESRHLGLKTAGEIADLQQKISRMADALVVDWEKLFALTEGAAPLVHADRLPLAGELPPQGAEEQRPRVPIAVARDAAFCFTYAETLEALERAGAELCWFSPLQDPALPEQIGGLYLPGGYPELYAGQLSANRSMLASVRRAVERGLPTVAECGGFLYLGQSLEDANGERWPMAGVLPGQGFRVGRLVRFGYAALTAHADSMLFRAGERLPVHEFHHWDSTDNGTGFTAAKPNGKAMGLRLCKRAFLCGLPAFVLGGHGPAPAVRGCRRTLSSRGTGPMTELELKQLLSRITRPDETARTAAHAHWASLAKPLGGLGRLETMLEDAAALTGTAELAFSRRAVLVLCADNGVVAQGVSQTDQSVTRAVAENLAARRTSVCQMAKTARCEVVPVDLGMAGEPVPGVQNCRIAAGTADFTTGPAMTRQQAVDAIAAGMGLVRAQKAAGMQLLATGEMGIGNTTTSSAVAAVLLGQPVERMTGRGAGLSDAGLARKLDAIRRGIARNRPDAADPLDVLSKLGGFDIAGLCGVFLGGALEGLPVLMDGFISGVAALCAVRLCPAAEKAVFASHCSTEPAARLVLEALGKAPLLTAGLHLGEGTGAVASIPLWDMALAVYRDCYSFTEGGITPYTPQC